MADIVAISNLPLTHVRTLSAHNGPVNAVTFNSTGRYALTAGADKIITLWNPFRSAPQNDESTGALVIHQFAGHGYEVVDVAVSEDNKLIASVGGDRAAFVWDVATGRINRKLFGHEQRLSAVALNVDATVLFTGSHDKSVRVWDLRAQSRSVRCAPFPELGIALYLLVCPISAPHAAHPSYGGLPRQRYVDSRSP